MAEEKKGKVYFAKRDGSKDNEKKDDKEAHDYIGCYYRMG